MPKGPEAFRTISEASREVGLAQHVLRFWETKFHFLRPLKRAGGRRFYRPRDIAMLVTLKHLLHDQGRPIKEVQSLYREQGSRMFHQSAAPLAPPPPDALVARLHAALEALQLAKTRLDGLLSPI